MRLNIQITLKASARLVLLLCFGTVSLGHTHEKTIPTDSSVLTRPSFAPGYFVIEKQKVGFQVKMDGLVVQTAKNISTPQINRLVRKALNDVFPLAQAKLYSVHELYKTGLFRANFTRPLAQQEMEKLASAMRNTQELRQVYPILLRGTGQAYTDQHLVVTAWPQQLTSVLSALEKILTLHEVQPSRVAHTATLQIGARHGFDALAVSRMLFERHNIPGLRSAEPLLYRELQHHASDGGTSPTQNNEVEKALSDQWHLFRNTDQNVPGTGEIFADDAWETTRGSLDTVIAIFDTGIDISHPLIAENIVGGFDAIDDDNDPSAECTARENGRDKASSCPDNKPFRETHGTAVSGIAVASGGNGEEVSGVCPECGFMPVRYSASAAARTLTFAESLVRAVDEGADIINNSWGPRYSRFFPLSTAEADALRYAYEQGRGGLGTLVFFSAGNRAIDIVGNAYARNPHTVTVGASSCLDDWAIYSNFGAEMDLVAPSKGGANADDSHGIVSTDVMGDDGYTDGNFTKNLAAHRHQAPLRPAWPVWFYRPIRI